MKYEGAKLYGSGYPYYWYGGGLWGEAVYPSGLAVPGPLAYPDRVGVAQASRAMEPPAAPSEEREHPSNGSSE